MDTLSTQCIDVWWLPDLVQFITRKRPDLKNLSNSELRRWGIKFVLSRYIDFSPQDIVFDYSQSGKPLLTEFNIYFNWSHSETNTVLAITKSGHIGIDIEGYRKVKYPQKIAKKLFHPADLVHYLSAQKKEQDNLFFQYWTKTEAYIKCIGSKLFLANQEWSKYSQKPSQWHHTSIRSIPDHFCSIVSTLENASPNIRHLSELTET